MRNIVNRLLKNIRAGEKFSSFLKVPVSPPKTSAEIDFVSRFAAQYYQFFFILMLSWIYCHLHC